MIDCHLHLQDPRLLPWAGEIMESVRSAGITTLVVNGTRPEDWPLVRDLALRFPELIPSYGLHPWFVGSETETWLGELESFLRDDTRACVGEIGLDRWSRNTDPARQREVFVEQLLLAESLERSVTIHCLKAWGTLLDLVREIRPRMPFLLHSYGGPPGMIEPFADLGAFFSLSGYFFRKDKTDKLATFAEVPLDRLLIETDAPDMSPPPGMLDFHIPCEVAKEAKAIPNHPANLRPIHQAASALLRMDPADFEGLIRGNFARWYHGSPH